jgi:uncharacterized protein (AIM24 family)
MTGYTIGIDTNRWLMRDIGRLSLAARGLLIEILANCVLQFGTDDSSACVAWEADIHYLASLVGVTSDTIAETMSELAGEGFVLTFDGMIAKSLIY